MRINELLESGQEHMYPQELWNEFVQLLQGAEQNLQAEQQADTSYSRGAGVHQSSSGAVKLEKGFTSHSQYGGSMSWNYALKIGTNVKDRKALEHAKAVYSQLAQLIKDAVAYAKNVKIQGDHGDVMHVGVDDRQFTIKYEYASNYCWVAIRVAK